MTGFRPSDARSRDAGRTSPSDESARVETSRYAFSPREYERDLVAILSEIDAMGTADERAVSRVLKRHPKEGRGLFTKSELVRAVRALDPEQHGWDVGSLIRKLRTKPIRTASGVAPLTLLTMPFPCPGQCIFCPSDDRMPKSYLLSEPGAQRAARHRFDPYAQTWGRLAALHANGHPIDKVELIVLGGTWSAYPEPYQLWFIERAISALNEYDEARTSPMPSPRGVPIDSGWTALISAQRDNEEARSRCVGLSLETRPDSVTEEEVVRLRRLGATKVQLGVQSLSDEILSTNRRGHDVLDSRRAIERLRRGGFKIQVHWMPNLFGSTPDRDVEDFRRLFADPDFRPDELKIYPCSLIESAELMQHYRDGSWRPYSTDELVGVLSSCLELVPEYCRVTRVIRDIPGHDIVAGNRRSNLRERVEADLARRGRTTRDIRSREIRRLAIRPGALERKRERGVAVERPREREVDVAVDVDVDVERQVAVELELELELELDVVSYDTSAGRESFLEFVTEERRIAAFLRLLLPNRASFVDELGRSAVVRELHVYGAAMALHARAGEAVQHRGLGRRLLASAASIASDAGYERLSVISAMGTRVYYRRNGFADGTLYQHKSLDRGATEAHREPSG